MLDFDMHKLAFIVTQARAYDVKEGPVDEDSGSNPTDDGSIDVLQDSADDASGAALREFLVGLNDEEKLTLVTLAWVGRGSFAPEEWKDALAEARRAAREGGETADYLLGMPMLGDLLAEGAALMDRPLDLDEV